MIRKTVSLLLCAALLAAVYCAGAESAFDGGVFAGKTGYTSLEDGGWTYVRGAELPYPGFVIAIRISVSGRTDGTVDAPRLEVGLLKAPGSGEAAAPVSGVTFYAGDRTYT